MPKFQVAELKLSGLADLLRNQDQRDNSKISQAGQFQLAW